jgi:hypothetical protein
VTGGAGRTRPEAPTHFDAAHTASWSAACHFLLVTIEDDLLTVRAVGEGATDVAALSDIVRYGRHGTKLMEPMRIRKER